ncbi:hypothetical protein [Actinokineospora pegani]|uniref:hypothetical protein n=1 Tax=Actinokineospora pegani TaxID=2654637 RepID=UPI0012EABE0B|nr:hypothetical protein [Actinokineospora pegani]
MLRALLRRTTVAALVAGALVAAAGATVSTVSASAAAGGYVPAGYYKNAHSDTIYKQGLDHGGYYYAISYAEWEAAGFPEPRPSPTSYVKYPWSPIIYAVTYLSDHEDDWVWERMTPEMWARSGALTAEDAGWIRDSYFFKWGTADEIFVEDEDGKVHKLTQAEWQRSHYRAYEHMTNKGFTKLSWAPEVNFTADLADRPGDQITREIWLFNDSPRPRVSARFAGDGFHKASDTSPDIVYSGPTMTRKITYNEWVAAGKPTPQAPLQ